MSFSGFRYFLCFVCIIMSGCGWKQNEQKYLLWRQQEARFFDIPIMMHAKPDYSYQNNGNDFSLIAYTVNASYSQVQVYYRAHMEKSGWRHVMTVTEYEATLIFEKPQKMCVVSLRPTPKINETKVVITHGYQE